VVLVGIILRNAKIQEGKTDTILQLKNVTKKFGNLTAVHKISQTKSPEP